MTVSEASFALRIVRRRTGTAAILYRRRLTKNGKEQLKRVAAIGTLAFTAGATLLRSAVRAAGREQLDPGPFLPLDPDWGARVACYALLAAGLCNADRLHKAAAHLYHADSTEAAWWFGLMDRPGGSRAIRALRILTEAVE